MPMVMTSNWPPCVSMSVAIFWRRTLSSRITQLRWMPGLFATKSSVSSCIRTMSALSAAAIVSMSAAAAAPVAPISVAAARKALKRIVVSSTNSNPLLRDRGY
ncbi:hypothetical protein KL86PLE_40543 [uncultured Pleomorphomonas sp.]|uniref:Uncharacterized protein n=1 Tax=uncultured Pleomorphomonas sp. TaxID=442121 RepID=A0A212LGW2_9HYPH|nr:hypothetical protein KL86PLE_40543 [uncultured Pleomorphomonas sp.]